MLDTRAICNCLQTERWEHGIGEMRNLVDVTCWWIVKEGSGRRGEGWWKKEAKANPNPSSGDGDERWWLWTYCSRVARERESAFTFGPSATCPCCGYQGLKGISTSTTTLTSNATLEGNGRHNNKGEYSKPPPYCLSLLVLIKSRGTKMKRAFCFNV